MPDMEPEKFNCFEGISRLGLEIEITFHVHDCERCRQLDEQFVINAFNIQSRSVELQLWMRRPLNINESDTISGCT